MALGSFGWWTSQCVGAKIAAMFIDGQRMVSVEDTNPKTCFE